MDKEVHEIAVSLRNEIGRAKTLTDSVSMHDVFMSAETIISILAYLISPVMSLETQYRELVVSFMEEGDSHAKAEAKARASKIYSDWKKLQMLCDLGSEQILILKKFSTNLDQEFSRTK